MSLQVQPPAVMTLNSQSWLSSGLLLSPEMKECIHCIDASLSSWSISEMTAITYVVFTIIFQSLSQNTPE